MTEVDRILNKLRTQGYIRVVGVSYDAEVQYEITHKGKLALEQAESEA